MVSLDHGQVVFKEGVEHYELNTPLFSDGATKIRTFWIPPGSAARYPADGGVLEFPEGTTLTKSFAFPPDPLQDGKTLRFIETRVEWLSGGTWRAVSYRWNDAQTEARVSYAGEVVPLTFVDGAGVVQSAHYLVPSQQQCRQCHQDGDHLLPLGPKPRNLNREVPSPPSGGENQLQAWAAKGELVGLPTGQEIPRLPVWSDARNGTLDQRARAYLDVNCSHCHRLGGEAENTGLVLTLEQEASYHLGICKQPGGTGPGPGGRPWEVDPGHPESSAVVYRMSSTTPGTAMPQIGRSLVHAEGVALVADWIAQLPGSCP
jgi:uncharacterized repeat protein (TIGR03806 family)